MTDAQTAMLLNYCSDEGSSSDSTAMGDAGWFRETSDVTPTLSCGTDTPRKITGNSAQRTNTQTARAAWPA